MGLDVRIYWLSYLAYFFLILLVFLLAPMLIAASAAGTVSAAGMPAFALVAFCSAMPILLFSFLLAFLFKTKEQASGYYLVLFIFLCLTPTQVLQALRNADAKVALMWAMMLFAPNQLLSGLTS